MNEIFFIVVGMPLGFAIGVNLCVYLENKETRDKMPPAQSDTSEEAE